MLRVLPLTFKPVSNLICRKIGFMWVVKRTTSLFDSFCSNVAKQVARFLLPVFPYLYGLQRTVRRESLGVRLGSPFFLYQLPIFSLVD